MKIIIASTNKGKFKEFKFMLAKHDYNLILPTVVEEIDEDGDTFCENARKKLESFISTNNLSEPVFCDDSGLCIHALNDMPGIKSARFATDCGGFTKAHEKIFYMLGDKERTATFYCCIALFFKETIKVFQGELKGKISTYARGEFGFGYDPLFIPEGHNKTVAEMTEKEKNSISARAKALEKMLDFIKIAME